jgi:voltage-gated potassium channel
MVRHDGSVFVLLLRVLKPGHRRHIAILLAVVAGFVVGGGALFAHFQHPRLPFTTGVYWAITTATTVGYGDVTPHTAASRVIASLVMLTTIPMLATVFALATAGTAVAGIRRILAMHSRFPASPYRLVIGMNDTVPAILDELVAARVSVVLVANVDPATLPPEVHLVRGDPTDEATIRLAKPESAEQALITGKSDGDVLVSSVLLRKMAPGLETAALVDSASVREALTDLGIQQTISAHTLVASALAKSLEAPHAGDMLSQLVDSDSHRLTEIEAEAAVVGRRLSSVRDELSGLVLGLVQDGTFTLGVAEDPVIQAGDRLLVAEPLDPQKVTARRR